MRGYVRWIMEMALPLGKLSDGFLIHIKKMTLTPYFALYLQRSVEIGRVREGSDTHFANIWDECEAVNVCKTVMVMGE
jgi:hypothetical protein